MARSFEQYVCERLAEILGETISAQIEPQRISAILTDSDDSKKFLIIAQLTIDCVYEKKIQASDASERIAAAVASLRGDHNISKVTVVTIQADRAGFLGKWQYRTVADFIIKAGVEW